MMSIAEAVGIRQLALLAVAVAPGSHRELVLSSSPEMLRLKSEAGGQSETSNRRTRRYLGLETRGVLADLRQTLAQCAGGLWQPVRAEDEQRDHEEDNQFLLHIDLPGVDPARQVMPELSARSAGTRTLYFPDGSTSRKGFSRTIGTRAILV